jgi:hypothetical protein
VRQGALPSRPTHSPARRPPRRRAYRRSLPPDTN